MKRRAVLKYFLCWLFTALICFLVAGCGAREPKPTIRIYSSVSLKDVTCFAERFEELYGVKALIWKGSATEVLTRTLEESRAGKIQADVVLLNARKMWIADQKGILVPYKEKTRHPYLIEMITLAYNTNEVKNPPRTYWDIFSPEYKGKAAMEIDTPEWETGLADILGEDYFAVLHQRLLTRDIRGVDGRSLLSEMVVSGEIPIAINLGNNYMERNKIKGAPVDWVALEPVVACPEEAALLTGNPDAGRFIDFLLSEEGQRMALKTGKGVPVDTDLESPLYTGFKTVIPRFE
jgi:iron(III) transport system substrate-binding protein